MINRILERLTNEAMASSSALTEAIIGMQAASTDFYIAEKSTYEKAIEIVQEESKNGGWIPCSERLPEEGKMVLVYDSLHDAIDVAEFLCPHWYARYGKMDEKITAWQPLPPAYRKEN